MQSIAKLQGARKSFLLLGLLGFLFCLPHQASAADIPMLPPALCPAGGGTIGVLGWDGANPLGCVKSFTADALGNLTIGGGATFNGTTTLAGATTVNGAFAVNNTANFSSNVLMGGGKISFPSNGAAIFSNSITAPSYYIAGVTDPFDSNGLATVLSLKGTATCATGYALTKNGPNSFTCVQMPAGGGLPGPAGPPGAAGPAGPQGPAGTGGDSLWYFNVSGYSVLLHGIGAYDASTGKFTGRIFCGPASTTVGTSVKCASDQGPWVTYCGSDTQCANYCSGVNKGCYNLGYGGNSGGDYYRDVTVVNLPITNVTKM